MQIDRSRLLVAEAEMQAGELKPSHVNRVGSAVCRMVDYRAKPGGDGDAPKNRLLPIRSAGIPDFAHIITV